MHFIVDDAVKYCNSRAMNTYRSYSKEFKEMVQNDYISKQVLKFVRLFKKKNSHKVTQIIKNIGALHFSLID